MKSRLLLDVVVAQGATILELLTGEDKALLIRGDAVFLRQYTCQITTPDDAPLLVLDLGLDVVDGVGRLHLKGDRLAREGLDENLHRKV